MSEQHWRLPDGIDEVLPPYAWALESLRREVLDVFRGWGYEYVEPPLVEYLESLLVGFGNDLELQTFRMVDQRSGRMLGIRADMTSQAARMDAHSLRTEHTQRLCYAGTVVHANPAGVLASRVPLIAGAELFGAGAPDADVEVVSLMVETLRCAGITTPVIELGHVGIFRNLARAGGVSEPLENALFGALQRKSQPDIALLLESAGVTGDVARMIHCLPELLGGAETLVQARKRLVVPGIAEALAEVEQIADAVARRCREVTVRFDLCELAGYGYHTGTVFAAYGADYGHALARGGRYDAIGQRFGRARPATGFDINLKRLPPLMPAQPAGLSPAQPAVIWAPRLEGVPAARKDALWAAIGVLRDDGARVVCALTDQEARPAACDGEVVWSKGGWRVRDARSIETKKLT